MKPYLLTLAILAFATIAYSQKDKDIPAWGKIEKADLEMKVCDFDKDAEAVVLFDVGNLVFNINSGEITLVRRTRIKILKEKGLSKADIKIPFISYRGSQSLSKVSAQTFNLDASGNVVVSEADKKNILTKALNKRVSEMVIAFPNVKVGSVIEYKYEKNGANLITWYFQRDIPVKMSRYKTEFPDEVEISTIPVCVLPYDTKVEKGSYNNKAFTMMNVPALRDEPFISNEDDYLQRIETNLVAFNPPGRPRISMLRSWPGIIKELMEDDDFGTQLKKNIPRTADLDEKLKTVNDPYTKMKVIYDYVRSNMTWNEYNSIWALEGVKSAWKDKKGTSGEINLILINLLKDAGLNAAPILVSSHDNGRIMTTFPGYWQFNEVLAYVIIDDKEYFLDATDKFTPVHLIPRNVAYTEGLVIKKLETFEWGWQGIWKDNCVRKKLIAISGVLSDDDSLKGTASVNSLEYDRVERMKVLKEGKDKLISKFFSEPHPDIKIASLELVNDDKDSVALVQKIAFTQPVQGSGDYRYFKFNLFTGLEKNPFLSESRFSDVFFGMNQTYTIVGNFKIPDGYTFEELPKNVRMIMPDTSIEMSRIVAAENNVVNIRLNLTFKKPFYSIEEYPDFREFYKKLFDFLNEQIVYRKKAVPKP